MSQSTNKVTHPTPDWIDILSQEPLPLPNLSTLLSVGINSYQKLLWERAQSKLERENLKHVIDDYDHKLKQNS